MSGRQLLVKASKAPIEAPLGLLLGGSCAFALMAMPAPLFSRIFAAEPLLGPRLAVAIVLSLAAGLGAWLLLRHIGAGGGSAAADGVPTLRRADAHPDAPPRRPIFATQDLGMPLMDVEIAPSPSPSPSPSPRRRVASTAVAVEEPLELTERVSDEAVRAPNPTITALMDRLKAGLERRAAAGMVGTPASDDPAIRAAVTELGRLARRR